jgi:BTB/POZ domain-containing protein KCTD9
MPTRKPYGESCQSLLDQQLLDTDEIPPMPERPPRHDDETLGVGFFRTQLADVALDSLTLPRTFFGRSEIRGVTFRDTDLSESTANWNDFIDVDFGSADLSRADLRASVFERVSFRGASLRNTDLRHATFTDCSFVDADLTGAKLARGADSSIDLSPEQRGVIAWQKDQGEEPEGG